MQAALCFGQAIIHNWISSWQCQYNSSIKRQDENNLERQVLSEIKFPVFDYTAGSSTSVGTDPAWNPMRENRWQWCASNLAVSVLGCREHLLIRICPPQNNPRSVRSIILFCRWSNSAIGPDYLPKQRSAAVEGWLLVKYIFVHIDLFTVFIKLFECGMQFY